MCSEVERRDKIFVAKWDSLYKHVGKRKIKKNFIINLPSFIDSYKNCTNFVLWLI
jgi:pyruvate/2-oxoacid:ferredoxin oxidoreductase beta subunit